jgi:DNA repair protein RadC
MNNKITYYGHRQRIKNKFRESGISGWHDYEILELVLSYAIPRKDTKPIAKNLIEKFGNLNNVINADIKDLIEVKGISEHTAIFIRLFKDVSLKLLEKQIYTIDLVSSPGTAYDYLKMIIGNSSDENFIAIFLNHRNIVTSSEILQKGTIDEAVVYPRKIVERALYHHAANVVISHNHPAGSLEPSRDDIKVTKQIKDALKTVDIGLLDHILVTKNGYYSFKENDML